MAEQGGSRFSVKKRIVYCRTEFIGYHKWPTAPEAVYHLRDLHRHKFHVEVGVSVGHNDRDVEFQMLLDKVNGIINVQKLHWPEMFSCEMMAETIAEMLHHYEYNVSYIDVSEDAENGARIFYE